MFITLPSWVNQLHLLHSILTLEPDLVMWCRETHHVKLRLQLQLATVSGRPRATVSSSCGCCKWLEGAAPKCARARNVFLVLLSILSSHYQIHSFDSSFASNTISQTLWLFKQTNKQTEAKNKHFLLANIYSNAFTWTHTEHTTTMLLIVCFHY